MSLKRQLWLALTCIFLVSMSYTAVALKNSYSSNDTLASISVNHVALSVPNFEETIKWYGDVLGFRPTEKVRVLKEIDTRGIFLGRNGFLIEIFERKGSSRSVPAPKKVPDDFLQQGYKHMAFSVADVDTTVVTLKQKGVEAKLGPLDDLQTNNRIAFIADNNGNLIELVTPLKRTKKSLLSP